MYNTRRYFLCAILTIKLIYKIRAYQYIVDEHGDGGDLHPSRKKLRAQISNEFRILFLYLKKKEKKDVIIITLFSHNIGAT